jgi:radical SAM protein with 4Fe4S-binding SPASM domain
MRVKIPKPVLLALELTRHCRFHCSHCRAAAGPVVSDGELTSQQWKKIIKAIANYRKCSIVLTGGEPMERVDIYELIKYGKSLGLKVMLATCGYLIDEKSILKLKQAGVAMLSLSLDGESAKTHDAIRQSDGSYDAVIEAANIARRASLPFQINSTISKINIDEVNAIARLAQDLGSRCYNPFILVPAGRGSEIAEQVLDPVEYETLLNRLLEMKLTMPIEIRVTCAPALVRIWHQSKAEKRVGAVNGCVGGNGFGFISYKGDVQVCGFLGIPAGNLIEKRYSFKKIWEESSFLNEIRDRSNYTGKCGACDYRDICGGCRARAYTICGDYLGSDPACKYKAEKKLDSAAD